MSAVGLPLNEIFPLSPRLLPFSTNAAAAESNVMLLADTPVKSLLLFNRVLPPKVSGLAKIGTTLLSQLPAVLQLLSAPPPSQMPALVTPEGLVTSAQVSPMRTSSSATVIPLLNAPKEMPLNDMSPAPDSNNVGVTGSVAEVGF